jgi:hypothetical protein
MACLAASLATGFGTTELMAAGKAEHVVVLVWDGMRPDFITPQFAPNLYSLATNGSSSSASSCLHQLDGGQRHGLGHRHASGGKRHHCQH